MALYLDAALLVLLFLLAVNYMRHGLWSSLLDVIGWTMVYVMAIYLVGGSQDKMSSGAYQWRSLIGILASLSLMYLLLRPIKQWMRNYYVNAFTIATAALVSPITLLLLVTIVSWFSTVSLLQAVGWQNSQVMSLYSPLVMGINDMVSLFGLDPNHPATGLQVADSDLLKDFTEAAR